MELPKKISYSSWMLFRTGCQHRWSLDYASGVFPKKNYGVHMDFGTACHAAIERYKTRKDPVSLDEAVEIFKWTFSILYGEQSPSYEENDRKVDPLVLLRAGENILRRFHECDELARAEVVYNEHKLQVPIQRSDGVTTNFKGYIDLVIKTSDARGNPILYIVDFKTCKWGWTTEKKMDRNLQFQLFLYKHFLCKKFNLDPQQVRCAFALLKKAPIKAGPPVEFLPVSAGPVSVQRAIDALNSDLTAMAEGVKRGSFKKDRSQCVNPFGQVCPHKGTQLCPD